MLFFIHYQGKEYRVRVESRRNEMRVSYGDEPEAPVDLHYYGHDCTFIDDNEVFHASVVGDKSDYVVWRPLGNFHFSVESEYRRIVGVLRGQAIEQENNVYAKMPGKIVKLSVKAGDEVTQGASILVMEAMKMENEIRSTIAGTVKIIHIKEGQAVETGTLLAELEPLTGE